VRIFQLTSFVVDQIPRADTSVKQRPGIGTRIQRSLCDPLVADPSLTTNDGFRASLELWRTTNDFKQTLRKPRLRARTVYSLIGGFDLRRIDSQSVRKYFFFLFQFDERAARACTFRTCMKDRYSKNLSPVNSAVKRHATSVRYRRYNVGDVN